MTNNSFFLDCAEANVYFPLWSMDIMRSVIVFMQRNPRSQPDKEENASSSHVCPHSAVAGWTCQIALPISCCRCTIRRHILFRLVRLFSCLWRSLPGDTARHSHEHSADKEANATEDLNGDEVVPVSADEVALNDRTDQCKRRSERVHQPRPLTKSALILRSGPEYGGDARGRQADDAPAERTKEHDEGDSGRERVGVGPEREAEEGSDERDGGVDVQCAEEVRQVAAAQPADAGAAVHDGEEVVGAQAWRDAGLGVVGGRDGVDRARRLPLAAGGNARARRPLLEVEEDAVEAEEHHRHAASEQEEGWVAERCGVDPRPEA